MRARHPDLFSDTKIIEHVHLDRAVFDHYLETLTSRKQELAFERFARKLAEKEICPNLVPQTGPTGGGDSKVDTETYPVSEDIADRWYVGQPKQAAEERWGFAISTKKVWKPKAKTDIASIAGTQRGYVRVYFITSQYVKDKDRGETQDDLRRQYGFDVQILDRSWILEKVFTNKREQLAIDTLDLERPLAPKITLGPRDTGREAELDELEHQIDDPARYQGIEYQLVEDCLETTLLARGLERPRFEVEGRFSRAIRIAEKHGTTQQQLRIAYDLAWTLYWWYEDYNAFAKVYDDVEQLAHGHSQVGDIELLKNLWQLLYTAANNNNLDATSAKLAERTAFLKQEILRLQQDKTRPTAALQARAQQLFVDLVESRGNQLQLKKVLGQFRTILKKSKGLIDFPARELVDLLMELGEAIPLNDTFDEVFEATLGLAQERDSSATAGRMLLRRGMQKLEHNQPYEAVRLLGRAQPRLAFRECRGELVTAFALCARAYEAAGLLWAARASMLFATGQALKEFNEEGVFTRQAYACLRRLTWIELQLCRVPCALAWIETAAIFRRTIKLSATHQEAFRNEWLHIDFTLGVLLLRTEFFNLKDLIRLPVVLERLGLDFSWIGLLYGLGHEDRLRADKILPGDETPDDVLSTFTDAVNKTDPGDLPQAPEFLDGRKLELRSSVLGCAITAEVPNQNRSLFIAEAILSALEAFLATSLGSTLLPYTASLGLKIIASDFLAKSLEWTILDSPPVIEIRHPTDDTFDFRALQDLLPELIITIMSHVALPTDVAHLKTLFRDEQAMGRAIALTNIALCIGNILGHNPKLRLADWVPSDAETFPLRRTQPWNYGQVSSTEQIAHAPLTFGTGDPPAELLDTEGLKHRDRKVISLINIPLWNKAGWQGAGFVYPDPPFAPLLLLLFKDRDAGARIFTGLKQQIGPDDKTGKLRVSIITGIDKNNPAHYRVLIGTNLERHTLPPGSHFVTVSRVHSLTPLSSTNLDRFLASYAQRGTFFLAPGHFAPGDPVQTFDRHLAIRSSQLNVRRAWEIGEHDPDVIGIDQHDNVVIPDGIEEPPVLRALERIRKRRQHDTLKEPLIPRTGPQGKVGRNAACHCGSGKKFKKCHGR